ncbi:hypothetical protein BOTNAR_0880g00040 [Botryotinia narcissicola]|uniref:Uncharacterized protein n=1 Tax=Botryotinia narcissicola TaxID=278944 RepID=A0A4Z1H525_9HELO|nr:hypothetical protein BOTNAR_0880g00040 [Botryotinia narcissicola]
MVRQAFVRSLLYEAPNLNYNNYAFNDLVSIKQAEKLQSERSIHQVNGHFICVSEDAGILTNIKDANTLVAVFSAT